MPQAPPEPARSGSDASTLARGAGVLLGGKFLGRAVSFAVWILLGRLLGTAFYGAFAIGWKILQLAGFLAALGLEQGVIRFGSVLWHEDRARLRGLLTQALGISLAVSSLLAAALFFSADWLALEIFKEPSLTGVLPLFGLGFVFLAGLRVAAAGTRTSQNMRYSVVAEDLVQPFCQVVLVLLLYWAGWRLSGAVTATLVSYLLAFLLALFFLHRLVPGLLSRSPREYLPVRELLSFSLPTAMAGTLAMLMLSIDVLLVGFYLEESQTGIYNAGVQISLIFVLILTAFNNIFAPMIADLHQRGELARLDRLYKLGTRWGLLVSLPIFILVAVAPGEVITLLFGTEYADGAWPMLVLCLGQMVNLCTGAVGFLLIMSGRQNWWLVATSAALVGNVAVGVWLIPRLGIMGAAVAVAVSLAGLFLTGLVLVRRSLGLWPYDRRLLKMVAAGLVAAAAVFMVGRLGLGPPVLRLVLMAAVSLGAFWAVLLLWGLDAEDRELWGTLLGGRGGDGRPAAAD